MKKGMFNHFHDKNWFCMMNLCLKLKKISPLIFNIGLFDPLFRLPIIFHVTDKGLITVYFLLMNILKTQFTNIKEFYD